jgi:membrane protease YdiL (CAAX protease family)
MHIRTVVNWKLVLLLLIACFVAVLAVLPYALSLQSEALAELPIPLPVVVLLSLLQSTVMFLVAIIVGLIVSRRVGLKTPILDNYVAGKPVAGMIAPTLKRGVIYGTLVGLAIILMDWAGGQVVDLHFPETVAPVWQGALASLYGGIAEEVLMRLFFMSVLVWLIGVVLKNSDGSPRTSAFWLAIVCSAVLFGLGHLPATAQLVELSPFVVLRAILLNGIGGIVFGWLFWKRGLETAMAAHFSTDIVLHVALPLGQLVF